MVSKLDHALLLSSASKPISSETEELFQRVVRVDFQPTCENILVDIVSKLNPQLPDSVKLHSLKLVETPTSFAEWFVSDQ